MSDAIIVDKAQLRYMPDGQFMPQPAAQEPGGALQALQGRLWVVIGIQETEKDLRNAQVPGQLNNRQRYVSQTRVLGFKSNQLAQDPLQLRTQPLIA